MLSERRATLSGKMKSFLWLLILLFSEHVSCENCEKTSLTTASGTHAPLGDYCQGQLIFEDNFDELNLRKWEHEISLTGSANAEFQWYTNNRSNSYTEDRCLHIRPTLLADQFSNEFLYNGTIDLNSGSPFASCTNARNNGCKRTGTRLQILNPIKSARIRTLQSFAFKYGKVETRAKVPLGDWLWPAIWMMPKWNIYSTWPASGEIDIMESRGNRHFKNYKNEDIGVQQVASTLHWGPDKNFNKYPSTHFTKNNESGFHLDFHRYQLVWTPDYIKFSIDDEETGKVTPPEGGFWKLGNFSDYGIENPWRGSISNMAPFDDEFYIIINLAVGSTSFFSDKGNNYPNIKPWLNNSTTPTKDFWENKNKWLPTWNMQSNDSHLVVDYIRVWAL